MSSYDYVFLAPVDPMPEAAMIEDLDRVLGITFVSRPTDYASHLARSPGLALDLGGHDLENDRDMNFADYPFVITIRKVGRDAAHQAAEARRVFDAIKATRRYRALLVNDLQTRMGDFNPHHPPTAMAESE